MNEIYHHGIKGQKWGVRRYQFADGSLTPAGEKRYYINQNSNKVSRLSSLASMKVKDIANNARTQITGKQYVDSCLKKGTTFSRIQTSKDFENFAFYATYLKTDSDKYMGLFGKNLTSRAKAAAKQAEKQANASGSKTDADKAKELRSASNNMKVYQLKISATDKLKVPSDENAGFITANLLKDKSFKKNVEASLADSKEKMRRPAQQILFKQAENALKKDPNTMKKSEKVAVYKAFNLSLTNHNTQEVAAQNRFYSELKKKGYNALLDYNDKEYSSYHAKRPMIIFDTDSVKLQAVTQTNPKIVDKMYRKYNSERIAKESIASTIGVLGKIGNKTISECNTYVRRKMSDYLS
ncbi:hypothetical protein [[Ruminococcus] lactaris]|jgi:hypothetical protein|uniref:hypothetical protein n=1 Tax=[Ruminococcus] lactaris TaxID=46228 RepID=UPI003FD82F2A